MKRLPLITTFILFIALCASVTYWAMQFIKPAQRAVVAPPQAIQNEPSLDVAASLFGNRTSSPVSGSIQLKGVVAGNVSGESVAILLVNGKFAQSFRVGAEVIPGVRVGEVRDDHVMLLEQGGVRRVDLPQSATRQQSRP
jgi:general secretion pathway protein C